MMYMNKHPKISKDRIKLDLISKLLDNIKENFYLGFVCFFSVPVKSLRTASGITRLETSISANANEKRNQFVRFCKRRSVKIARQTSKLPITPTMEKDERSNAGQ